jgi:hypothetical protein
MDTYIHKKNVAFVPMTFFERVKYWVKEIPAADHAAFSTARRLPNYPPPLPVRPRYY